MICYSSSIAQSRRVEKCMIEKFIYGNSFKIHIREDITNIGRWCCCILYALISKYRLKCNASTHQYVNVNVFGLQEKIFMNPILWPDMMFEILNKTYLIGFYYLFPHSLRSVRPHEVYCFYFPRFIPLNFASVFCNFLHFLKKKTKSPSALHQQRSHTIMYLVAFTLS